MKKILLTLFIGYSVLMFSQQTNEFYGKLNYVLVPHNNISGAGYTIGYEWNIQKPISFKIEMGTLTSNRVRKVDMIINDIRLLDLYYNIAQMHASIIPVWNLYSKNRFHLKGGLGLACAYQSKIFTVSHYEYKRYTQQDYWQDVINVEAENGLYAGAVADFNINYQLSENWKLGLSTQYQTFIKGESVLNAGISIGYSIVK